MIDKITIIAKFIGKDNNGIFLGGKKMRRNFSEIVHLDEDTYKRALLGSKNGWLEILKDNYSEYLESRGRRCNDILNKCIEVMKSNDQINIEESINVEEPIVGTINTVEGPTDPIVFTTAVEFDADKESIDVEFDADKESIDVEEDKVNESVNVVEEPVIKQINIPKKNKEHKRMIDKNK